MGITNFIAIAGIVITFIVSCLTLYFTLRNNRQTLFVNTVTTSRLKWIDSLRDKVSEFIAVSNRLVDPREASRPEHFSGLLLQRDALLHQIVLHLNPIDPEDQKIKTLVDNVRQETEASASSSELAGGLLKLRDATADYLKKEWNRVKVESIAPRG
jgi:hypothetical protein